jgi:hypothetical protein
LITALTPTGARPEAFAACVEMMRAQTYGGPVRWVIVDDGPEPETFRRRWPQGWDVRIVRPEPLWEPGWNTLARNILAGLDHCGQRIVIVEDDDQYAPWWLERVSGWLDHADLVGECNSLYVVRGSGKRMLMGNKNHASLCSTALKGPAVGALRAACEGGAKGIDLRLWRAFRGAKRLYEPNPRGVTGVKGWPGRPGIGVGHRL